MRVGKKEKQKKGRRRRRGSDGPTGKGYVRGASRRGLEKMAQWVSGKISGVGLGAQFFLLTTLTSGPILSAEWLALSTEHQQYSRVRPQGNLQHVKGRWIRLKPKRWLLKEVQV